MSCLGKTEWEEERWSVIIHQGKDNSIIMKYSYRRKQIAMRPYGAY